MLLTEDDKAIPWTASTSERSKMANICIESALEMNTTYKNQQRLRYLSEKEHGITIR